MKKRYLLISILLILIIVVVGSTYAFFNIQKNMGSNTVSIISKTLKLEFNDGPELDFDGLLPGVSLIKTFSIENTNSGTFYYNINLIDVINELSRKSDLVYTITSTNDGAVISETTFLSSDGRLASNIEIPSGVTQEYTLTIRYKNLNEDQSIDMSKTISGTIEITEGVKTYNLTGIAYDNNGDILTSGYVEVHSDVIRTPINSDGTFLLEKVPVGEHTISILSSTEELISEDNFKLEKATTVNIENNEITSDEENKTLTISLERKASDNVEIKLLGNLYTANIIVNNGFTTLNTLSSYANMKTTTATISNEEHYHYKDVICTNGQTLTINNNQIYIRNITSNTTCTINYEIDTHTASFIVTNGTVSDNSETVSYNGNIEIELFPISNYNFDSIVCTNNQVGSFNNKILIRNLTSDTVCTIINKQYLWNYNYTGDSQEFIPSRNGRYKVELWGASATGKFTYFYGGNGSYTKGEINLSEGQKYYVYVGKLGMDESITTPYGTLSFNGASGGNYTCYDYNNGTYAYNFYGGSATDIRIIGGQWSNFNSLKSRIMVAAAGSSGNQFESGAPGGGLNGYSGKSGTGATQTSGGGLSSGGFGYAGIPSYSGNHCSSNIQIGASSGYYGGGASNLSTPDSGMYAAGSGSSFISGHNGCNAISSLSTVDNIIHTGSANHYSGKVFTNTLMIDGAGYKWTNNKESLVQMPKPDGTKYESGFGHTGNGYAKITYIGE